jgi:hypothetical protein
LEDYVVETQSDHRPELQESAKTVYERRSVFYEEVAKHIFVYPQYEKVKKLLGNMEKYYQTITKLFKKFVKRILFGIDSTIWAPNTFFLCIDYQNLTNLQLNQLYLIKNKYELVEIRADGYFISFDKEKVWSFA